MKNIFAFLLLIPCFLSHAQSILQEQKAFYDQYHFTKESDWDQLQQHATGTTSKQLPVSGEKINSCSLNGRRVYGWHPYWNGSTLHNNYQWNLLSDLCYFDYTINPSTGSNSNSSFAWNTSAAITAAKNNGVKISFCATLFSSHSTFLNSVTAKNTFIQNVVTLLKSRGGSGVCIDFESMAVTQRSNFVSFIQNLSKKIHDSIPGGEVAVTIPAVDWNSVFDIATLKNYIDLFIIMGYDYYYAGSGTAGPTDPLYPMETSFAYSISKSISYYLNLGVTSNKLLLAVPYYGRQYQVAGNTFPSTNTGGASLSSAPLYKTIRANASGNYSIANKKWDSNSFSPYYTFQNVGSWYQCFIDDSFSMGKRYDIVNQRNLSGIAIWTLGNDDGYQEMWNAISDHFSGCYTQHYTDSLFDMGGPNRNYNDKENYTYTISPPYATSVTLNFSQFELEANYDSLWLYNGTSATAPLLGKYSGTNSPGIISSTAPSLTLRFKSDGATNKPGYKLNYSCRTSDNTPPVTSVASLPWITGNFTAGFTDSDLGTGIQYRFYSVEENTPDGWRGNKSNGFFNDAFDGTAIHPDWTKQSGSWSMNANMLFQSDQQNPNTNIYTSLVQNSNQLLYHWTQKINGSGNNKRGGLYFMCSNPSGNGRGNSYLLLLRVESGGKIQIHKSINDMVFLYADISYPLVANITYDVKIIYNKLMGLIQVFIDDKLAASWTDTDPYISGNYISFRSGECTMNIDNLEVLKSRTGTAVPVTAGAVSTNDIRTQNTSVSSPGVRIKSVVTDFADQFSATAIQNLNVDYTNPSSPGSIRDGLTATDIAITSSTSQLSANWNVCSDANSAIKKYWYAIGTTPGAADVSDWTDNATNNFAIRSSLLLTVGNTYYFSVKAENGAGLFSNVISSNGQKLVSAIPTETFFHSADMNPLSAIDQFTAYPNPSDKEILFKYSLNTPSTVGLIIYDANGRTITILADQQIQEKGNYTYLFNADKWAAGIYHAILKTDEEEHVLKILIE